MRLRRMIRRAARLSDFMIWILENGGTASEGEIVSSGFDAELNSALCRHDVDTGPHPMIKDRDGKPSPYFFLTAKGRRRAMSIKKSASR
jgi:hypothetical protein